MPDLLGKMTAIIHECHADSEPFSVFVSIYVPENIVERFPHLRIVGPSHDLAALYAPAFIPQPVPDNLIFQAVILDVNSSGKHKHAGRKLCFVFFAPGQESIFILEPAAILPQFAK